MTQPRKDPGQRFLMVDGLRGVAAMLVVFFHLNDALGADVFPALVHRILTFGDLGVDIFFVLSGFVITHSVRNGLYTLGYLGRFALRRSIRLDPPLWTTIAIEVAVIHAGLALFPDLGTPIPTLGQIAANVAYLQGLLGIDNVVTAFWSLTYEVQFYVVVVASLVAVAALRKVSMLRRIVTPAAIAVSIAAFIASFLIWHQVLDNPMRGLFLQRWFQFFLGALAWAAMMKKIKLPFYVLAWVVCFTSSVVFDVHPYRFETTLVTLLTSALLLWAGRTGRLATTLDGPVIQFLGRISYSLYLIHLTVGWRFVSLSRRMLGGELSMPVGVVVLAGGIAVSILTAWLMYRVLEAPSMRFARRVKMPVRP